jgi:hypothetical protein
MRIMHLGLFFLAMLAIMGVVSCVTEPPPAEEPQPQAQPAIDPDLAPPDQASLNSLNAATLKTDNARKLVMDFNGPDFFPQEWASAENLYNRAQGLGRNTAKDVREAIPLYNQAADAYEALAVKTILAYKEDLEDKIITARNDAIYEGAVSLAPEYLLKTDNLAIQALAQYEEKDYYAAQDTGLSLLNSYNTMIVGLQAYKLRLEMDYLGLYWYDPATLDAADKIGYSALDDFMANDLASAANKANNVLALYEGSYTANILALTEDLGALATAERARALDARANVAARQEYNAANTVFIQGVNAFNDRDYGQAARDYVQSREMFIEATAEAVEKRLLADEAIREAEFRLAESDEAAYRAELLIGGVQ